MRTGFHKHQGVYAVRTVRHTIYGVPSSIGTSQEDSEQLGIRCYWTVCCSLTRNSLRLSFEELGALYMFVVNILFFHFSAYVFFLASSEQCQYHLFILHNRTAQKCISCIPCEHLLPIVQTVQSFRKCFIVLYSYLFDSRFSILLGIGRLNQHLPLRNLVSLHLRSSIF